MKKCLTLLGLALCLYGSAAIAQTMAQNVTPPSHQVMSEPVLDPEGKVIPYDGKKHHPPAAPAETKPAKKQKAKTTKPKSSKKAAAKPAGKNSKSGKQPAQKSGKPSGKKSG